MVGLAGHWADSPHLKHQPFPHRGQRGALGLEPDAAGARSPGTAAFATALRAAEQGSLQQTTVASQIDRERTPG